MIVDQVVEARDRLPAGDVDLVDAVVEEDDPVLVVAEEDIVAGIAEKTIAGGGAHAVDILRAEEHELLDIGRERVGDG